MSEDNAEVQPHHEAHHEVHHEPAPQPAHTESASKSKKIDISGVLNKIKKEPILAFLIYLVIALIMFAPIAANMKSVAPGTGGDTYDNLWSLWWVNYATFNLHASIWSTFLLYFPVGANLVYQTMSPLGSLMVGAFEAISVPFAYNVFLFLGFALSGICMYILADYITKNKYAAFFAGLVFAFSSTHIPMALDHIDWIMVGWIPLALYFFLRMIREYDNKYINAAGLGIAFVLTVFMGDIEQGVILVILFILILVVYALYKGTRHLLLNKTTWIAIVVALIIAFVLGSWGFLPIINTIIQPGGLSNANYLNTFQYNELWSDDLLSFFLPSYYNGLFNGIATSAYYQIFAADPSERAAYIGYTVLALAIFGIYKSFRNVRLWLIIALVFGWLALGPFVQISGAITPIPGLYYAYHSIPYLSIIREPGRFDIIFVLAVSIIAAVGVKEFTESKAMKGMFSNPLLLISLLSVLFLIESNGYPLTSTLLNQDVTNASIPNFYAGLNQVGGNFSVLSLPALPNSASPQPQLYGGEATYYETANGRPIVGGEVTRENYSQQVSLFTMPLVVQASSLQATGSFAYASPVNQNYSNQTIVSLYNYRTGFVVLMRQAYNTSSLNTLGEYLVSLFGNPVYVDNTTIAFATSNAINNTLFKSYVAYPSPSDWQEVGTYVNGSQRVIWEPGYPGAMVVYAPYANTTNIGNKIYARQIDFVNTTVSFQAMSLSGGPATFVLGTLNESTGSIQPLTTLNLTTQLKEYSDNISLPSGPYASTLLFLVEQPSTGTQQVIGVSNITFSKIQNKPI